MATDRDRLRAEQLYVQGGKACAVIASDIGVARSTIYEWRNEGAWDAKRKELSDRIGQVVREASDEAAAVAATKFRILSRAEGLAIVAEIACSTAVEPRDRLAAVKLAASIDAWGGAPSDDGDGPPTRVLFNRAKRNA